MFSCLSAVSTREVKIHLIQTHESIILMYSFAFDGTDTQCLTFLYLFAMMCVCVCVPCTITINPFLRIFSSSSSSLASVKRRHRLEQIKRDQENIIQIVGFRCDQRKHLREYNRKRSKITNQTIKCVCLRKIQWEKNKKKKTTKNNNKSWVKKKCM